MTGRTDRQTDQRMYGGAIGAGMLAERHRRSNRRESQSGLDGPIPAWGTNSRLGKNGQTSTIVHSEARRRSRAEVNWEMSIKADPGQKTNVINQYPEVVVQLRAVYDKWWDDVQSDFVHEDVIGPKMNPLKVAYWDQFGGGPDEAMLKKIDPMNRGHQSLVDKALAKEEGCGSKTKEKKSKKGKRK